MDQSKHNNIENAKENSNSFMLFFCAVYNLCAFFIFIDVQKDTLLVTVWQILTFKDKRKFAIFKIFYCIFLRIF